MLPKRGSRRMLTMEQANERVRSRLLVQVEYRRSQGLPRMAAYGAVASALGRSESWVRKIIGRSPLVSASAADWFNLEVLCARIDAVSERLEARAASIRGDDLNAEASPIAAAPREGDLGSGNSSKSEAPR